MPAHYASSDTRHDEEFRRATWTSQRRPGRWPSSGQGTVAWIGSVRALELARFDGQVGSVEGEHDSKRGQIVNLASSVIGNHVSYEILPWGSSPPASTPWLAARCGSSRAMALDHFRSRAAGPAALVADSRASAVIVAHALAGTIRVLPFTRSPVVLLSLVRQSPSPLL